MAELVLSGKRIEAVAGMTIEQTVIDNGMHPDSYLYLIEGRPVPMDTVICEDTVVKVLRVASGG